MRVATRRSREALRIFGASLPGAWSGPLMQDLRWIGAVLGRVRDFDVQLERLANYRKVVSAAGQSALRRYRRYLLKGRHRAHRQLVDALAGERYQKLVSDYRSLVVAALASGGCEPGDPAISATIGAMVPVALAPPLQALLKQGNRTANRRTREHLHKVRIASKRLRYLLEYLQPVDGVTGTDGIGALTRLQDTLGGHQDACSARERLRVYRRDIAADKQDRKHIRRLMAFEERRAARAQSVFRHDWKTFNGVCNSLVLC
jgi:CHAD domain-containing protein